MKTQLTTFVLCVCFILGINAQETGSIKILDASEYVLNIGDEVRLRAYVWFPGGIPTERPVWASSDPSKVRVNAYGHITALAAGEVTIMASIRGLSHSITVKVKPNSAPAEYIKISSPEQIMLAIGNRHHFFLELPKSSINRHVAWKSSNPVILPVSPQGEVHALGPGEAEITASIQGPTGTLYATVKVSIESLHVDLKSVTIVGEKVVKLKIGAKYAPKLEFFPANASYTRFGWTSSDPSVAMVDRATGVVTAQKVGTTTIKATYLGGKRTITTSFTVLVEYDNPNEELKIPHLRAFPKQVSVGQKISLILIDLEDKETQFTYKVLGHKDQASIFQIKEGDLIFKKTGTYKFQIKFKNKQNWQTLTYAIGVGS